MKHIYVISVFPELIKDFIDYGVLKKGQDKSLINIEAIKQIKTKKAISRS